MTTKSDVATAIKDARQEWDQRRRTVAKVAQFLDVNTTQLAIKMDMKRSTVTGRLKGTTKMEPWELPGFAAALGVPADVLELSPDEAIRWIIDHPEIVRNRCSSQRPSVAA